MGMGRGGSGGGPQSSDARRRTREAERVGSERQRDEQKKSTSI